MAITASISRGDKGSVVEGGGALDLKPRRGQKAARWCAMKDSFNEHQKRCAAASVSHFSFITSSRNK